MKRNVSVKYAGGQKVYTIPFEYLAKKFVHVVLNAEELISDIDYRIENTQVILFRTTSATDTIEIYRYTTMTRLVSFNDGSVLRGADLTTFQMQILHVIEEQGLFGVSSGGDIIDEGVSYATLYFNSVREMQSYTPLAAGYVVHTRNYYENIKGGGAKYRIVRSNKDQYGESLPWAIPLVNGLFAIIDEHKEVNYRQFGALLDGESDDAPAMRLCHKYADTQFVYDEKGLTKQYLCKVVQHDGIIYKKGTDAITCSSDVDLSGATLLVNDTNATWYGIYVWGDNASLVYTTELSDELKQDLKADTFFLSHARSDTFHPNTIIKLEEDPYCARDDAGYLYTVPRRELLMHDMDGIFADALSTDWTHAGGEEINCQISDLTNGSIKNAQSFTNFRVSYTYYPPVRGTFVGCDVRLDVSAHKYCSVMWCKRHNATVRDFTFRPKQGELHNRKFKNAMIYLWDSYNVCVKNLQGFNASGKKEGNVNGTSGYMLRITNCADVHVEDCQMQGYWGATAMDSVKNIHFRNCHLNRLDIHDYFSNLYAEQCVFYNHAIQIGYGRGVASFTNCVFHYNDIPQDSYGSAHMVEFNLTYGRIFEGLVNIDGCRVVVHNPADDEFNIFKMEFSPDATTISKSFQIPEIICRNCVISSNDPNTHFSCFKVAGTRRATSGAQKPTHVYGVCNDGSVTWQYFGRGVQWGGERTEIKKNEVVRISDTFLDKENKTQFYNVRYYICTKAGTLSFHAKPTRTDSSEFACGTATLRYAPDLLWKSKYGYESGDICAVSQTPWYELYMFVCVKSGTSGGYFPTHTYGTQLDGVDDSVSEPDGCWWTYVGKTKDLYGGWTPRMSVAAGQKFIAEGRMYEVITDGILPEYPPYDTAWFGTHQWGTATLKYIGQVWSPHAWYAKDSFCEARGNIYRLAKHDGTTSGVMPVRGNPYCVDGDIIWEYVSGGNVGGAEPPIPPNNEDTISRKTADNPPKQPIAVGSIVMDGTLPVKYLGAYKCEWRKAGASYQVGDIIADNTFFVQCIKAGKTDANSTWGPLEGAAWNNDGTYKDNEVIWKKLTPTSQNGAWRSSHTHYAVGTVYYADQNADGAYHLYQVVSGTAQPSERAAQTTERASGDTWRPTTAYRLGDTVISNGNKYRCIFDGVVVLPQKTIFENIITNMQGHVFWFYKGTDIPTRQGVRPWEVLIRNCTGFQTTPEGMNTYFGHSNNPSPIVHQT